MMPSRTDDDWQKWGEIDPYFGVASAPMFRKEELASNLKAFFDTGDIFITERLATAKRHFGFEPYGDAFDFGCGVGRLILPLARHFEHVVGADIADAMLREARKNANGLDNIRLVKADEAAFTLRRHYRFINSYIVLQHIPRKRGMAYTEKLLDMVAPGGVAALHFSIRRKHSPPRAALYLAKKHIPGALAAVNLLRRRRRDEPLMQMNEYSLGDIIHLMSERGFGEAVVGTEMHSGVLTACVMAQRSQ